MANVRDLKKDINKMVEHLIQECYVHLSYSPPVNQENVLDIISDSMLLRSEMIHRISNAPKTDGNGKPMKSICNSIADEFYDRIVELTERLNTLD